MSAQRRRQRGGGAWAIVGVVAVAALALWWLSTRRAEAPVPPASAPGARVLGEAPSAEEISPPEKEELERILRERGGAARSGD